MKTRFINLVQHATACSIINVLSFALTFSCVVPLKSGIRPQDKKGVLRMGAALNNAKNLALAGVLSLGTVFFANAQSPANNNDLLASNDTPLTETVDNRSDKKVVPLQVLSLLHVKDQQAATEWFKQNGGKYPVMIEVCGANSDDIINFVGKNMRGLQYTGLSGLVLVLTDNPPNKDESYQGIFFWKNGELYNYMENPDLDDIDNILLRKEIIALYNEVYGGDIIAELYPELSPDH